MWALRIVLFAVLYAFAIWAASSFEMSCFFFFFFFTGLAFARFRRGRSFFDGPHGVLHVVFGPVRVPDVQCARRGELGDPQSVGLDRLDGHRPRIRGGEAVVPGCDCEAGRHPLQVILERSGQGLVEVVEVEQQLSLR